MAYRVTPPAGARLVSKASKDGGLAKLGINIRVSTLSTYQKPDFEGDGYLAGEFPGGTTTINGVPTSAQVRVLWRDPAGGVMDGYLAAKTNSAPDGTWQVLGLDPAQKFDIVGRKEGYNDAMQANVSPIPLYIITKTGDFVLSEGGRELDGGFSVSGGLPPYTITVDSGTPPSGWVFSISGRSVISTGNASESGDFAWTFKVVASNGAELLVPVSVEGVKGISFGDLIMDASPICYLRFNETSGTVATDSSGHGNHGAYTNTDVSFISADGLLDGDADLGIDITAKGPYVTLPTTPINTAGEWTVGIIVRPDSVPPESGSGTLLQIGGDDGERPLITFANMPDGKGLVFIGRSGSSQPFLGAERFTYGTKLVIFFTHSPNEGMRMIINNRVQGYAAQVFGTFTGATRIGISKYGGRDPEYPFIGAMDEVTFFDKVLTDDKITELTNAAYSTPQENGKQVLLLHMEGADGSTDYVDSSPSAHVTFVDGSVTPKISTAWSAVGDSSAQFFGAGYAGTVQSRDYDFGSGDFTLKGYVYLTAYAANNGSAGYGSTLFATYRSAGSGPPYGWQIRVNGTASSFDRMYIYTGNADFEFPFNFALNTEYHVTVSRKAGVVECDINGKMIGRRLTPDNFSGSVTGDLINDLASPRELLIGGLNDSAYPLRLTGFMDEIEFNKGWCLHPTEFNPADGTPLVSAFRDAVLAEKPYIYYRMSESLGGAIYDSASMARNGVIAGTAGTDFNYSATGLSDDDNKAMSFATDNGYVRSAARYSLPCAVFTLSCIVKINSGTVNGYIAGCAQEADGASGAGPKDRGFYTGPDGKLHFYIYDGAQRFLVSPAAINDGQRHILHATVGAGSTEIWIDGEMVASGAFVGTALYDTYLFGARNNMPVESGVTLVGMRGVLDELAWYNKKLSPEQVLAQAVAAGLAEAP